MSRDLTAGLITEFTAAKNYPFVLFQADFPSQILRLWTGYGDLSWSGVTWLGNGWLRGISDIVDATELRAQGVDISLAGVPLALVSLILSESKFANRGYLWVGCVNSSGAVVVDPYLLFDGTMSAPSINDSPENSEIILSYDDDLLMLQRSKELRYDHDSQQSVFPGDQGFAYVAGLQEWSGFWGVKAKSKKAKDAKNKGRKKKGRR